MALLAAVLMLCLPVGVLAAEYNLGNRDDLDERVFEINSGDVLYGSVNEDAFYFSVTVNGSDKEAAVTLRNINMSGDMLELIPGEGVESITVILEGKNTFFVDHDETGNPAPLCVDSDCTIRAKNNGVLSCGGVKGAALYVEGTLVVESGKIEVTGSGAGVYVQEDFKVSGGEVTVSGPVVAAMVFGKTALGGGTVKLESDSSALMAGGEKLEIASGLDVIENTAKRIEVTDQHDWKATYISNGEGQHYRVCKYNEKHVSELEKCSGGTATATQYAICMYCNEEYGELLDPTPVPTVVPTPVPETIVEDMPQTGDESNMMIWAALLLGGVSGMALLMCKKKEV